MAKNPKKPKPKSKPKAEAKDKISVLLGRMEGKRGLGDLQEEVDALLMDIEEGSEIAMEAVDAVIEEPQTDDRISQADKWERLSIQALALANNLRRVEEVRRKGLAKQITELRKNLNQSKPKIKK